MVDDHGMSIVDSRSKLLESDSTSEIVKMWRRLRVKGFYCLLVLGCIAFSSLTGTSLSYCIVHSFRFDAHKLFKPSRYIDSITQSIMY